MRLAPRGFHFCALALILLPASAAPDPCRPVQPRRLRALHSSPEAYVRLSAGGMHLGAAGGSGGVFAGVEAGFCPVAPFDFGITVDYFRRTASESEIVYETDGGYVPPVRVEVTRHESNTHLVPIGLAARWRLPLPAHGVAPYVAAHLSWDILVLELHDAARTRQPYGLGSSETFTGFGAGAAAGVEFGVAPGVAVAGEVGVRSSSPSQVLHDVATPTRLRVDVDGAFLRLGLRLVR